MTFFVALIVPALVAPQVLFSDDGEPKIPQHGYDRARFLAAPKARRPSK
jgi:hypothetical protein